MSLSWTKAIYVESKFGKENNGLHNFPIRLESENEKGCVFQPIYTNPHFPQISYIAADGRERIMGQNSIRIFKK